MKKIYILLIIAVSLLCWNCKLSFDNKPANTDLFELIIEYDQNQRIIDTLTVKLSWSDITIENFKEIKITRLNEYRDPDSYPVGLTENGWITIAQIQNEFITSYVDTIQDDAPFKYRVEYLNQSGNYRRAETTITIRPTTHLTIPDDYLDIKTAVESYIIDDGDSVLVKQGTYVTNSFSFLGKSVNLIGIDGAQNTELLWIYREIVIVLTDSTFIKMTGGLIKGFSILGSWVTNGGAITASGESRIEQCIINYNTASKTSIEGMVASEGGYGGGIYITGGTVTVKNCLIFDNTATDFGSGIYINSNASAVNITNCTFSGNNLFNNSDNVLIENSIFNFAYSGIDLQSYLPDVKYSYAGTYWRTQDTTNVSGDLLLGTDFHLLPGSVGIDAGNPDPAFNDPDGSRNNIGAFGGHFGAWN